VNSSLYESRRPTFSRGDQEFGGGRDSRDHYQEFQSEQGQRSDWGQSTSKALAQGTLLRRFDIDSNREKPLSRSRTPVVQAEGCAFWSLPIRHSRGAPMGGRSEKWSCQIHRIQYAMHRFLKKAPTELRKAGPA
jgi:hypothetical protein